MEPAEYVGATFSSTEAGDPFITFADDGTYKGSDGCNGFHGNYEVEGDRIMLDPDKFSTLKGCVDVDDWLRDAESLQLNDETMTVFDASDNEIGTLTRG